MDLFTITKSDLALAKEQIRELRKTILKQSNELLIKETKINELQGQLSFTKLKLNIEKLKNTKPKYSQNISKTITYEELKLELGLI